MNDIISYYDITEEALKSKAFESGAYYCCTDSRNIYFDSPNDGTRVRMSSDIIILSSESERANLLAPIPDKIYCVLSSATLYIYSGAKWYRLGKGFQVFASVTVDGTLTYTNANITATSQGYFIPDPVVEDLVTSTVTVVCNDGSATVTLACDYPIPGMLIIQ